MTTPSPNRSVMIVLAYLWPLAIVPLLVERNDAEVQWHAKHGLVLFLTEIVVFAVFGMVVSIISFAAFQLGCVVSMLAVFIWIAILAVHIAGIVFGINGKRLLIPGVSEYASRF